MKRTRRVLGTITTTLFLVSGGLLEAQEPPFEGVCRDQSANLAVGAPIFPAQDLVPGGAAGICNPDLEALRRYWQYRRRLVKDFLVVGDCCGCSLPAFTRGAYWENSTTVHRTIDWADSGLVFSGYISVLATEYKLLSDSGQDTSQTGLELYHAINAFNRLDGTAEPYWRAWKQTGSVPECTATSDPPNGFFIRDDVPSNFLLGAGASLIPGVYSHFSKGLTDIDSGFITGVHKEGFGPREQSLDQTYPLILAFGLVSKFVPSSVTVGSVSLSDEARQIVTRIVNHMRSGYFGRPWVIQNPATGECPKGVFWKELGCTSLNKKKCVCGPFDKEKCICGGADNRGFSYGIAMAHCEVDTVFSSTKLQCESGYVDPLAALSRPVWLAFEPLSTIGKEEIKVLALAATGDSWLNTGFNVGRQAIYNDLEDKDLVYRALFGGPTFIQRSHFQCLIDTAPCEGPSGQGPFEWSSNSRFRNAENRGSGWTIDYNGLDYMLLYNLYRIAYGNTVSVPYEVTPDECDPGCDRNVICDPSLPNGSPCTANLECRSHTCAGCPLNTGWCVSFATKKLGEGCLADAECSVGKCSATCLIGQLGVCQCTKSSDCDSGNYCDLGTAGIGRNECKAKKGECAACSADWQCLSGECRNKPAGLCITPASVNIGATCCKDAECGSGSCNSDRKCQCTKSSDCPAGNYCDLGTAGIGRNECKAKKGECATCSADWQCLSGECRNKPAGLCITPTSVNVGASCCKDAECKSGSCNSSGKCQCTHSSDCPSGRYCDLGFFTIGQNECRAFIGECKFCLADKECGPGRDCKLLACITPNSLGSSASCCRDNQCTSGKCKNASGKCK
jgi:Cys-rich repeat protein